MQQPPLMISSIAKKQINSIGSTLYFFIIKCVFTIIKERKADNHVRLPDMVAAFTAKHKPRYP